MSLNLQSSRGCISWTHYTCSLHHGCSMVSRACNPNCYALLGSAKKSDLFQNVASLGSNGPKWNTEPDSATGRNIPVFRTLPSSLLELRKKSSKSILADLKNVYSDPGQRRRFPNGPVLPAVCFIDSYSDFFHKQSPIGFMDDAMDTFEDLRHKLHFQLLTKRPDRLLAFSRRHPLPRNAWVGVTLETTDPNFTGQNYSRKNGNSVPVDGVAANWFSDSGVEPWRRAHYLAQVEASIRFLSIEPMVGPIQLPDDIWKRIHWVIIGGESNNGVSSNPVMRLCDLKPELLALLDQCRRHNVKVWFKQWGSYDENGNYLGGHSAAGHEVEGMNLFQWPDYYIKEQLKGF